MVREASNKKCCRLTEREIDETSMATDVISGQHTCQRLTYHVGPWQLMQKKGGG
jgi:hypothetical protein